MRHILGLSGGKDSTALALYLRDKVPDIEYYFSDTGKELPETYAYLHRLEAILGKKINYLSNGGFDHWFNVYKGLLPSVQRRWCTRQLKIAPMTKFAGNDDVITYAGIRADEDRVGYISTRANIRPAYPFMQDGLVKKDILQILQDHNIGLPEYYTWRSRSGCYFCFFQRKIEWVRLSEIHPDLFQEAIRYERGQKYPRGVKFRWNRTESLLELLARKDQIIERHEKMLKKKEARTLNRQYLLFGEEENDEDNFCYVCHL
jgi:3'-phosphoadenosine 5'-phosphosulfate sulfotransferase (PAPS reductase)/FAD synthetase